MKKIVNFLLFILFLAAVFISCDTGRVYDEYQEIPGSTWNKDSLVHFQFQVEDTLQNHNLLIQIRHETNYNYSNLWLFVEFISPGGEVKRDTFEIILADPSGQWFGEGFGGIKSISSMFRRGVFFPVPGEYKISIQQGMRDEELRGVHDVGFRVEKTSQ